MEITHNVENEILIFAIKGRLDAATAPIAEETIKEKLAENTNRLLFDLSELEQPCSESSPNFSARAFGRAASHLRLSAIYACRRWPQPYDIYRQQLAVDKTP